MIGGILSGLFGGWILSLFGFNDMLIEVCQPFFADIVLTNSHYYIAFAVLGLIGGFLSAVFGNRG